MLPFRLQVLQYIRAIYEAEQEGNDDPLRGLSSESGISDEEMDYEDDSQNSQEDSGGAEDDEEEEPVQPAQTRNRNKTEGEGKPPKTVVIESSDIVPEICGHCGIPSPFSPRLAKPTFTKPQRHNLFNQLRQRGSCPDLTRQDTLAICQTRIPNRFTGVLEVLDSQVFCGIYSPSGSVYMSAAQDGIIRLYDAEDDYNLIRTVTAQDIGWSIIDTDYSRDQRFLIYSSWSNYVHLCNVYQSTGRETHIPLDFNPSSTRFCLFSVKFSHDNGEILGGSSDNCIYIYDLQKQERTLRIASHANDVNAVAFADESTHILFSGSDDRLCKVWDRRDLRRNSPVGVFAGHMEGITYIDPRGDGRYLLTNAKDQSIKLWDLRNMGKPSTRPPTNPRQPTWDYRGWDRPSGSPPIMSGTDPRDRSLMTYTGHRVNRTLIRAKFSPLHTTGQRYIYSGSANGYLHVWDILTGELVSRVRQTDDIIRDVSWHPFEPKILTASWDRAIGIFSYVYEDEDDIVRRQEQEASRRHLLSSRRHRFFG